MDSHQSSRESLDKLFCLDSIASFVFGAVSLLTPHGFFIALVGSNNYNHTAHETLRLYGCLRMALGWILFHVRSVDDGRFRRSICEALCICYALQSLAVLRAQLTSVDDTNYWNWLAFFLLVSFGSMYAKFRFGNGGNRIKVYELPSSSARNIR